MLKIKLNATTSYLWTGASVGIVRTESEIIKALQKHPEVDLQLFIVQDREVSPITYRQYVSKGRVEKKVSRNSKKSDPTWIVPLVPKKHALKLLAQACLSLSPVFLRPSLNKFARIMKRVLVKLKRVQFERYSKDLKVAGSSSPNKKFNNTDFFEDGDVIFTCGLDWETPDLFECLYFLKKTKKVKVVSFCHDLIPVNYPHLCTTDTVARFTAYFLDLIESSDLVCCNSKCTQKDLSQFIQETGTKPVDTKVLHLGADFENKEKDSREENLSAPTNFRTDIPFILYVSTIERRKNHEVLYRAYRKLIKDGFGEELPYLYFVGMKGWGVEDFLRDLKLDPLIKDKIQILGRVNDSQLSHLYKNAKFVVFPSFYEGWGLAVGEAFSYGKFVLCSSEGSLSEVGQGFADYLDPLRVDLWAEKILFYTQNSAELGKKEKNIKQKWRCRTWEDVGRQLITILNKIESSSKSTN